MSIAISKEIISLTNMPQIYLSFLFRARRGLRNICAQNCPDKESFLTVHRICHFIKRRGRGGEISLRVKGLLFSLLEPRYDLTVNCQLCLLFLQHYTHQQSVKSPVTKPSYMGVCCCRQLVAVSFKFLVILDMQMAGCLFCI